MKIPLKLDIVEHPRKNFFRGTRSLKISREIKRFYKFVINRAINFFQNKINKKIMRPRRTFWL